MFENLSNRLDGIVKRLRGKGRLTEADVDGDPAGVRAALLDADVHVGVTREVVERIRAEAIGATRSQVLDPGQQVVKIVNGELTRILGGESLEDHLRQPPADGRADGRPAGLGQDDCGGEAGPLVQGPGPQPAARRRRPPAPGCGRTAAHPRAPYRRAGVLGT